MATGYQLTPTGDAHGTIRFVGAFDTLNWKSSAKENWNGFTIGVEVVDAEVSTVPEPSSLFVFCGLLGLCIGGSRLRRRRRISAAAA